MSVETIFSSRQPTQWYSLSVWSLANVIGWGVGMTIGLTLWYFYHGHIVMDAQANFEMEFALGDVLGSIMLGLTVAVAQGWVFRHSRVIMLQWIGGTGIGIIVAYFLAHVLGYPFIHYADCSIFCFFAFDLPPHWLPSSIGMMSFTLGGPIAGALMGGSMALGQILFLRLRFSAHILWIVANALSLALALTLSFFVGSELIVVSIGIGAIFGLTTALPFRRLVRFAGAMPVIQK